MIDINTLLIKNAQAPELRTRKAAWLEMSRFSVDRIWIREHPELDPRIEDAWMLALGHRWAGVRDPWLIRMLLRRLDLLDPIRVQAAIVAIKKIDGLHHASAGVHRKWQSSEDPAMRQRAAIGMFSALLLRDPDPIVRLISLYGLARRPLVALQQREAIQAGLEDGDSRIRLAAARALRTARQARPEDTHQILEAQRIGAYDPHPEIRWALFCATRSHAAANTQWRLHFDTTIRPWSRAVAFAAPAGVLSLVPLTARLLSPLLDRGDLSLRMIAARALAVRSESTMARQALRHAALDPSSKVRKIANYGLFRRI